VLDHVKAEQPIAKPVQRRHQRCDQREPTGRAGNDLPESGTRTTSSSPEQNKRAHAVHETENDERENDPGIERPMRAAHVRGQLVGMYRTTRQQSSRDCRYLSHPVKTREAMPCIAEQR
jgi:hypothetical protein